MADFGVFGSVEHHDLTVAPAINRRKRCRDCKRAGVRKASTHVVMANGVALAGGCEFHARQWQRKMIKLRRSGTGQVSRG